MRSILPFFALASFFAGCEVPTMDKVTTDDTGSSEGETGGDTGTGEDTDTATDTPEGAEVRFINVSPEDGVITLHVDSDGDGFDDASAALSFGEADTWQSVPAGSGSVFATNEAGEELWRADDFPFDAGYGYSVACTNQPGAWIKGYWVDEVPAGETTINVRNATQEGEAAGWFGLFDGEYYNVSSDDRFDMGANGEAIFNYAPHDNKVMLEAVFSADDDLLVDWQVASVLSDYVGGIVDLYLVVDGDCSYMSSSCDPQLIAQLPDGSAMTFEADYGWAVE